MKGVVKYARGIGNLELRELPEPSPAPDQVKIAVEAAGICGTDIHIWDDEYRNNPPVVLGHECAGRVVEVGSQVSDVKVGDRVTALPFYYTCGKCQYCLEGFISLCPERVSFGSGANGAFAAYLVVPAKIVRHLPENIDFDGGALTEPVACCVKAAQEYGKINAGDLVMVIGPGAIGLIALQLAKSAGATTILVGAANDTRRLALGRELGADEVVRVDTDDLDGLVSRLTRGKGVDVVLECAGVPAATRTALHYVRKRGQLIQMGLHGKPFELDFEQVVYKDVQVIGSFASSANAWDRALQLMSSGIVKVKPLVGAILPLEEWERGFEMVRTKESIKVLLKPQL